MAKKNLINADMLLATPRKIEPLVTPPPTPSVLQEEIKPEPPKEQIAPIVTIAAEPVAPSPETIPVVKSSVQKGLKEGETRATFIMQEEYLEKIKAIAYWDRKNIKDVLNDAMSAFIADYEKRNGAIQRIP